MRKTPFYFLLGVLLVTELSFIMLVNIYFIASYCDDETYDGSRYDEYVRDFDPSLIPISMKMMLVCAMKTNVDTIQADGTNPKLDLY